MPRHLRQVSPPSIISEPPVEYEEKGFVRVPNQWIVWASDNLSPAEVKLILILARYQGKNEWAYPAQATLAANMQFTTRGIRKLLMGLKKKEQIEEEKRPGKTTHYRVTLEPQFLTAQTCRAEPQFLPPRNSSSYEADTSKQTEKEKKEEVPDSTSSSSSLSPKKQSQKTKPKPSDSIAQANARSLGQTPENQEKDGKEKPVSQGVRTMSKPHLRVIMMIADRTLDPACVDDAAFMDTLAAIPDEEWSDDHEILAPWRRTGGVPGVFDPN